MEKQLYQLYGKIDNQKYDTGIRDNQLKKEIIRINVDPDFDYGHFYFINRACKRKYNEDRAFVILKQEFQVFGIFDGHGGEGVSQLARDYFFELFSYNKQNENLEFQMNHTKVKNFFQKHIDILQQTIEKNEQGLYTNNGSTVNIVFMDKYNLYCINLGDSRSIGLKKKGKIEQLTIDHKPYNILEQKLMEKKGTFLKQGRVNGILAVSRALGDSSLNLDRKIDMFTYKKKSFNCICCASDGIFDVIQQQEIFDRINNNLYMNENANPLSQLYKDYKEDFEDNISMIYYIQKT